MTMPPATLDGNNRLSAQEMIEICKLGQGPAACRYIGNPDTHPRCLKHTAMAGRINDRVNSGSYVAQGDNCEGKKP